MIIISPISDLIEEWLSAQIGQVPLVTAMFLASFIHLSGFFTGVIYAYLIQNSNDKRLSWLSNKWLNLFRGLWNNNQLIIPQARGQSDWPSTEANLPFEVLEPHDMSLTLEHHHRLKRETVGDTKFLKEIGWFPCRPCRGTSETYYSEIISALIDPVVDSMPGFHDWKITSDKMEDVFESAMTSIDKAPIEHHRYFGYLWSTYKALADHVRDQEFQLTKLDDRELVDSFYKDKNIGSESYELGVKTWGEYFANEPLYKTRVQQFKESLKSGKPMWGDFELISKPAKKRKENTKCRLVYSLKATARIYEHVIFGNLDSLLEYIPYTVKGVPHHRFGMILASIMSPGRYAICEDISGWDTKVSYTMLCMEANFLRLLTDDLEYKQEIWDLCRLYSYPLFVIKRNYKGKNRGVLYQLRGQVASGKRTTYAMNTISNIVINMCRAAISQGVAESDMYQWARDRLNEGHSDRFGGKISGDDSVIVLSREEAKLYANEGAKFLNNIGMPRKGLQLDEVSRVSDSLTQISFCSHHLTEVKFFDYSQGIYVSRWLRVRPISEIIAKACIKSGRFKDPKKEMQWARTQGLLLIIEFFYLPTIKLLALAILSATPQDALIELPSEYNIDVHNQTKDGLYQLIRERYDLEPSASLDDIQVSDDLYERYDCLYGTSVFKEWKSILPDEIEKLRSNQPGSKFMDWLPSRTKAWFSPISSLKNLLRNRTPQRAITYPVNQNEVH